jgi:general secretion pathway protein D
MDPRDPTVAAAGLQARLLAGSAGGIRSLRLEVVGVGTNASQAEVEDHQRLAPSMRRIRVIDAVQVSFGEVARVLARGTGLNIAPSSAAATNAVTLHLTDVPAGAVLETLCTANGLWHRADERTGIIRVYTVGEYRRDLASLRDETTEVFTLLYPNATDIANSIADLFGDRVEVSAGDADDMGAMDLQQRMMRFDVVDQRAFGLGHSSVGGNSSGGGAMGGGFGRTGMAAGAGGMSFMGGAGMGGYGAGAQSRRRTAPANLTAASAASLSNPNMSAEQVQALADAVARGEGSAASVQVDGALGRRVTIHVSVMKRQNKLLVRTADEAALRDIRGLVAKLDVPQSMVLLDVRVLRVQLGDGMNSAFDYSFAKPAAGGLLNGSLSPGEILPPTPLSSAEVASGRAPNFNPGGSGFDSQSMVFQYLGQNVRARLSLLETKGRLKSVASPVLLTANNEVSRVFVGEEVPITRGFNGGATIPTSGSGVVAQNANAQVEFRPVGTTLLLTPNINADRTVTLRLVQENSSLRKNGASIPVPSEGGGFRNQPVDVVQSRTVSGTFMAQHEESVVVGGLIEEQESSDWAGVPFLSRVPVLGVPFRRETKARSRSELVVIIRPFIVNTPREAEAISARVAREISLDSRVWSPGAALPSSFTTNDVAGPSKKRTGKKTTLGK